MDAIYTDFARANTVFYDHPKRLAPSPSNRAFTVTEALPAASRGGRWRVSSGRVWVYYTPPAVTLPEQGWKIHLSASAEHAEETVRIAAEVCVENRVAFKHLSSHDVHARTNAKDAPRESAGKLVTVYTGDDEQLETLVRTLGRFTAHLDGPHILSDLRWVQGPVFVRYGGFHPLVVVEHGVRLPALRHPDGHLVPDRRQPFFDPPAWAKLPAFLQDAADELSDKEPPTGFPFVTGVLHHSNAGGIYTALDDGQPVVLKEARPLAGTTPDGRTAIERARTEESILRRLSIVGVVKVVRSVQAFGHHYLVLERVDGVALNRAVAARHPLVYPEPSPDSLLKYQDWAAGVTIQLRRIVRQLHDQGVTHGDLHPGNVLVNEDGQVTLVDFEMATEVHADAPPLIGVPGFVAPMGTNGVASDLFALERLELFLYAPVAAMLDLHPALPNRFKNWAHRRFSSPSEARGPMLSSGLDDGAHTSTLISELSVQLVADATPERADRLWPGDPAQFDEPGYSLAHGALGPLVALHTAGAEVPEQCVDWVADAVAEAPLSAGLMDGLAGAALGLRVLGRESAAHNAISRCLEAPTPWDTPGLHSGPTGTALAYLRHPELHQEALRLFYEIADRSNGWIRPPAAGPVATGSAGLLRGHTGAALLALSLHDAGLGSGMLALAEGALRADLAACTLVKDGSSQVHEGWRYLPYLGAGSAGIAYVLAELLHRLPGSALAPNLPALVRAAYPEFVLEPGLLQGRAGLMLVLAHSNSKGPRDPLSKHAMERHLSYLRSYAIPRPYGLGMPGRGLMRLSCDLATGSAGVLWALTSLRDNARFAPPFLDLPPVDTSRARDITEGGR